MTWLRRTVWLATAAYWLLAFVLTHTPVAIPLPAVKSDKTEHFIGYALLGAMLYASLRLAGWRNAVLSVLVIGMCYGAADEQTQKLVGRSCELADWFADCAGLAFAASMGGLITLWRERRGTGRSW
jgi:VanZ family protein